MKVGGVQINHVNSLLSEVLDIEQWGTTLVKSFFALPKVHFLQSF